MNQLRKLIQETVGESLRRELVNQLRKLIQEAVGESLRRLIVNLHW